MPMSTEAKAEAFDEIAALFPAHEDDEWPNAYDFIARVHSIIINGRSNLLPATPNTTETTP